MKGVVKTNISPTTGHRNRCSVMAASPASVEPNSWSSAFPRNIGRFITTRQSSETEKRLAAPVCRPQFYLSLVGLLLFQVVRGGIESLWVFSRSCDHSPRGSSPSTPSVPNHADDERASSSVRRQIARNGYVVQFSFFGSNVSPFFQMVSATAAILRASVSRAISLRMPRCCKLSR
jgi:hypothetical protein